MNDSNVTNNLININLPDEAGKILTDVTEEPIQTFRDIWFLVFGGISQSAKKKKLKYQANLAAYEAELSDKISKIPESKKIDPSLQIAGQALDDSRYCIETEELRKMFSNLIANSMNADYEEKVHPSFSKIIQQMSGTDAKMLQLIQSTGSLAIVDYKAVSNDNNESNDHYWLIEEAIPGHVPDGCSYAAASRSLFSLERLGLIALRVNIHLADEYHYSYAQKTDLYLNACKFATDNNRSIEIEKRVALLTTLGKDFISVCLD